LQTPIILPRKQLNARFNQKHTITFDEDRPNAPQPLMPVLLKMPPSLTPKQSGKRRQGWGCVLGEADVSEVPAPKGRWMGLIGEKEAIRTPAIPGPSLADPVRMGWKSLWMRLLIADDN
jgi:hypothetical protein